MFDFKDFSQLGSLLKEAMQVKQKIDTLKEELAKVEVEGESGGGMVKVKMNGKFEVLNLSISEELFSEAFADKSLIEAMVLSAINITSEKVRVLAKEKMKEIAGGIEIPGLLD
ncbi:MAG TPA: YbaB/EbfC family nucleoid-associated protein [Candidatus Hydrogenedens sp.]|nr:YbaB/EbfC family nucleoid-associated protein [Candidatus Hydrogenedens sp.]HOK09258.1 YbaB/EbfC family nucleoid-associated protein [Candidatus Hydrogenedens sp.]HOL20612.1 YbaB/EbfC family nucleoid-associated protein [Candidatus Hydrogenedens sp.]HPP59456.1 YbaB/EbfC family nucleoid-associated protein [Candidatus Hydrogenedens sp.]